MRCNLSARFVVYLLAMTLIGCAVSKEIYLTDGSKGHSISCDGAALGMNTCFEKAGDLCGPRGYDQLNRDGQIIPTGVRGSGVSGNNLGFEDGMAITQSIMIRCRN